MIKFGDALTRYTLVCLFSLLFLSNVNAQGKRFLAVLPFSNTGSEEYAWISRGIEEILYEKLDNLDAVQVYERETIMRVLRDVGIETESDITVRKAFTVGKETGVDVLIVGSYAMSGSTLGIQFRAISTYTGGDVFLKTFKGPLDDLFQLLEDAMLQTLSAMLLSVNDSDREMLARVPTKSMAAFEYYCKAYVQFQNGAAMETVAGLFNQAITLDPNFWEAQYNLGVIYFNYDQYGRALSQFEKVSSQNPNFYKPYYGMGIIFFLQRNYQKAIENYTRVLNLSPDHDRALYYLGRIHVRLDSIEKGLDYLNKSAELNPNYPPTHFHIGMANMQRGWYKSAVKAFRTTIKLDPENYLAHNALGECFYRLQRFDEAIFEYNRTTEIRKDFSTAYFNIGNTIYKRGALQDIVDSYLEILETRYSQDTGNDGTNSLADDLSGNGNAINTYSVANITNTTGYVFSASNPATTPNPTLFASGKAVGTYRTIARDDTGGDATIAQGGTFNAESLLVSEDDDGSLTTYANGSSVATDSDPFGQRTFDRAAIGALSAVTVFGYVAGEIKELIIYNTDQSDNRFKIESNINNHYGIYTAAEDGFVATWYDQSGNGNDATASQDEEPKIVIAGTYLGELDFDGVDDFNPQLAKDWRIRGLVHPGDDLWHSKYVFGYLTDHKIEGVLIAHGQDTICFVYFCLLQNSQLAAISQDGVSTELR